MCCCVYMRFGIFSSHNILHLILGWIWLLATLTGTEISSPNLQLKICSGHNVCSALICNHAWFNLGANLHWPPHTILPHRRPWNVSSPESWLDGIASHLYCLSLSDEQESLLFAMLQRRPRKCHSKAHEEVATPHSQAAWIRLNLNLISRADNEWSFLYVSGGEK